MYQRQFTISRHQKEKLMQVWKTINMSVKGKSWINACQKSWKKFELMWVRFLFVSRGNFLFHVLVSFSTVSTEKRTQYCTLKNEVLVHDLTDLWAVYTQLSQSLELSWSFSVTTMFLSDCLASLLWWCRWWWRRWWWRNFRFRSLCMGLPAI